MSEIAIVLQKSNSEQMAGFSARTRSWFGQNQVGGRNTNTWEMVKPINFNGSRPCPKQGELFMPLKMTRRRFARISAAAGASVWVRPVFGETHEAAEWVNPLIGASTSQKLGEGKTFPGRTTPFGL